MSLCQKYSCNKRKLKGDGRSYHKFPANKELSALWTIFCDHPPRKVKKLHEMDDGVIVSTFIDVPWEPPIGASVCSNHFEEEDYRENSLRLKRGTVPSIEGPYLRSELASQTKISTRHLQDFEQDGRVYTSPRTDHPYARAPDNCEMGSDEDGACEYGSEYTNTFEADIDNGEDAIESNRALVSFMNDMDVNQGSERPESVLFLRAYPQTTFENDGIDRDEPSVILSQDVFTTLLESESDCDQSIQNRFFTNEASTCIPSPVDEHDRGCPVLSNSSIDVSANCSNDVSANCSNDVSANIDDDPSNDVSNTAPHCESIVPSPPEQSYIVFRDQLESLMNFCPVCGAVVISKTLVSDDSSVVNYELHCDSGCVRTWSSQSQMTGTVDMNVENGVGGLSGLAPNQEEVSGDIGPLPDIKKSRSIGGQCFAANCWNYKRLGLQRGLSFHKFPQYEHLRGPLRTRRKRRYEKWLMNCGRTDRLANKASLLCSEHFTPDCYEKLSIHDMRKGRILKADAIPTIFDD